MPDPKKKNKKPNKNIPPKKGEYKISIKESSRIKADDGFPPPPVSSKPPKPSGKGSADKGGGKGEKKD